MAFSEDVESRFAAETSGVSDPEETTQAGEVIPPRPAVEEPDFPVETFITEEMVGAILSIPGAMMYRRTEHEHWLVSEEEKQLIGEGATPVIRFMVRKWLSDSTSPYAALLAVLAVVYGPKALTEVAEQKRKKQNPSQTSPLQRPQRNQSQQANPRPSRSESAPSSASEDAANPPNSLPFAGDLPD